MTTTTYKGYTIKTAGISHYIYRNAPKVLTKNILFACCDGYTQSMVAARRWINKDIAARIVTNWRQQGI